MENNNSNKTIMNKITQFFKSVFLLIINLLLIPFEIIKDIKNDFAKTRSYRKQRKELNEKRKTEIKNLAFHRKIIPEIKFQAEIFPYKQVFFEKITNLISSILVMLGFVISFLVPFGLIWISSNIASKYVEEFLFVLLVLPITVVLFLIDTIIKNIFGENEVRRISKDVGVLFLVIVCSFLLAIILFFTNSSQVLRAINVCIIIQFLALMAQTLLVTDNFNKKLISLIILRYRYTIITFEKSLRNFYFNLSNVVHSQEVQLRDIQESSLAIIDEDKLYLFHFNKREYLLRSKFFFDELLRLTSENTNNRFIEEWLVEALGEVSVISNWQGELFEPVIKSLLEFTNGNKALLDNNLFLAKEKFEIAVTEWKSIRFRKIRKWSDYFQIEILKINMREEKDARKKTLIVNKISHLFYRLFKSLWRKDFTVFLGWITNRIYFLTRSARGGNEPQLVQKAKNSLLKLERLTTDSENEIVLFHKALIAGMDQYTHASHNQAESTEYRRSAIAALDDAQQYYDTTLSFLKHDFILKDTWEKIYFKVLTEKPLIQQPPKKSYFFYNFIITLMSIFLSYLVYEVIIGGKILIDLSTRNLIIIAVLVTLGLILFDLLKRNQSVIRRMFRF